MSDAPGPAPTPCPSCKRPLAAGADECGTCGRSVRALCVCGATLAAGATRCPSCGKQRRRKRRGSRLRPAARLLVGGAALALVAGAAWFAWENRPAPTWKRFNAGSDAYDRADYPEALRWFESVLEDQPEDAAAWLMKAACYQQIGHSAEVYVPAARKAVEFDPNLVKARLFLARAELAAGRVDEALVHARAATAVAGASPEAWVLLAEAELRRARPDVLRAHDCLRRARDSRYDSPQAKVLLAETTLWIRGGGDPTPVSVTSDASAALRDAELVLDAAGFDGPGGVHAAGTLARIQLALGRAEEAERTVDRALERVADAEDRTVSARLLTVRAAARLARGQREGSLADYAEALRRSPTGATAASVTAHLVRVGEAAAAETLLTSAAADRDPSGEIHAELAVALLHRGALDEATRAADVARSLRPDAPHFATVAGDVLRARRKWDEARAAYDEASRLAPDLLEPRVRRALLALDAPGRSPDVLRAAERELEDITTRVGEDASLLVAIGRLRLADDRAAEARAPLERATEIAPGDPSAWIALAEAVRRGGGDGAERQALRTLARARSFLPADASLVAAEASARLASGDASGALAVCGQRLEAAPDDAAVLALHAQAYASLDLWEGAAGDLRRLAASAEPDPGLLVRLVDAEFRAGRPEAARRVVANARGTAPAAVVETMEFVAAIHDGSPELAAERLQQAGRGLLAAKVRLALGQVDAAVGVLRDVCAALPGDPEATRLLVLALLDGPAPPPDRIAEARVLAARLSPEAVPGLRELIEGRVLLAEGDAAGAATLLTRAAALLPEDAVAQTFCGEALHRAGRRDEGLALLRRAAILPGSAPALRAAVADRLLASSHGASDPLEAEALAQEAMRLLPDAAAPAERLAELFQLRGDFGRAAETAEKALRAPGLSADDMRRLRYRAAVSRYDAGGFDAVLRHLDALPPEERGGAFAQTLRAFSELAANRLDEAESRLRAVLEKAPADTLATLGLAAVTLARGDAEQAEAVATAYRAANPGDRDVTLGVAGLLFRRGRLSGALRLADAHLADHPGDRVAAALAAETLRRSGRAQEAVARIEQFDAAAAGPERLASRLVAGLLLVRYAQDGTRALGIAKAVAADPEASPGERREARLLEAEGLVVLGRDAAAEEAAADVARSWPDGRAQLAAEGPLELRVRMVRGLAAARDPARRGEALEHFSRALELAPGDPDASNNVAWLLALEKETARRAHDMAVRCTQVEPGNPGFWDTRAVAAAAAGAPEDAEAAWTESLRLFAALPRPEPERRGAVALRFAAFLRKEEREREAVRLAEEVVRDAAGTQAAAEAAEFLRKTDNVSPPPRPK